MIDLKKIRIWPPSQDHWSWRGGKRLSTMISCGITGVDFIAANTDAQALRQIWLH